MGSRVKSKKGSVCRLTRRIKSALNTRRNRDRQRPSSESTTMSDLKTLYEGLQRAFYAQPSDLEAALPLLTQLKVREA